MVDQQNIWQNLLQDPGDLNKKVGEAVYVLIVDDIMIASTRKMDINEYLTDEKAIVPDFLTAQRMENPCEGIKLIYGMVLDSSELPLELAEDSEDLDVWVIMDDPITKLIGAVKYASFNSIEEAAGEIENSMKKNQSLDINDITVVVGTEVSLVLQVGTASADVNARKLKESLF